MRVIRAAFSVKRRFFMICLLGFGIRGVQKFRQAMFSRPPAFSRAFFALFLVILLKVFVKKRLNMGRG